MPTRTSDPSAVTARLWIPQPSTGHVRAQSYAPAILTSLVITALSFLPVFAFTGETGRLLRPLALTKTLVVASVEPSRPLIELQAELERLMQRLGLDPEGRKFTPHVTLARLHDASSQDVADYLSVRGYFPSRTFMASRFVLFSSRASTGGGPYVVEDSYALSA